MNIFANTWNRLGINVKLVSVFVVLMLLIITVTIIGAFTNRLTNREVNNTLQSTEIKSLVAEINQGLQDALASEANFFSQYATLGISDARERYAFPTVATISDVILKSQELRTLVENATNISTGINEGEVNIDLFLSAAERNADIFLDAVDTITLLSAPETGLESQLLTTADTIHNAIEELEDEVALELFYEMHLADRTYMLLRQRPDMQSAFNRMAQLRQRLDTLADIDTTTKADINGLLGEYTRLGNEIIAADVILQSHFNDFELQVGIIDPISEQLVNLANQEVVRARQEIAETSTLSNQIQIASSLLAVVVTLLVAYGINVSITRNVIQLRNTAAELQSGNLTARANINSRDELGALANTLNSMAQQLQSLVENLEQRVQERTRDLNMASQVSQQVTRVLDMKQLLPYLSNLTQEGFDLSHVSVFVYDPDSAILGLQAGSGEIGQTMLEAGKQFALDDKGLVPLAARTFELQIIDDVLASSDHFVNSLLPHTRSEMAVPMRVGTKLIGVLDLQSNEVNRFTGEQANILNALADQIAIAIQNADLFTAVEISRAEAEQANLVKSQFLAAMSHELRTPLNAVLNFTQFVSSGMLGDVNDEQVDMLDKVVQSGKHLLSLINDVLDISKIESGALKLFVEEDINLAAEVETLKATAEGLIAEKPITLSTNIDPDLPLVVGDKRRLRQIMLNLVSNACKFTDAGEVRISMQCEVESIRFAVQDTGPGIASEDYELIFETFRQSNTGIRQGEGTGLGLPISRRLAEAHGGQLGLESTVGLGTTFYFTIPINNSELTPLVKRKDTNHVT
ncbi:MAG: ATP-binding protein [Anaerolineae bacterium]|nr:ATP-binding protein [Anaerolineae bacterium]